MKKSRIKSIALGLAAVAALPLGLMACGGDGGRISGKHTKLIASYSFEDIKGYTTYNAGTKKYDKLNYIFSDDNAENLVKEPSAPLTRAGVKGRSLYMDGFSVNIETSDFTAPSTGLTLSAWVAPRVFENLPEYGGETDAKGHPRLTSVVNYGNLEVGQGFCFGYGRLGLWGVQLALYNYDTAMTSVVGFYDPINALPLYEWSHIAVSFDGDSGYIALFYNGEKAYEDIIPELVNTEIVENSDSLHIGAYCQPVTEFSMDRQMPSGLMDEVNMYDGALAPSEIKALYDDCAEDGSHPELAYGEIALDPSVYEGDRYRPQYHALPPAVWMNEPHSPFYYKGRYHVFYQANPSGPYWSQIRWGHIVSDDMIHWKYVKDAVVPTKDICPEGVWTGGACIGPDGTPWLAITAGTNQIIFNDGNPISSGQNVAFAHAVDPDDPDLTEWVVEDKLSIAQPMFPDSSMGERDQFRDPFVWYDDDMEQYYMLVSTSVPGAGGTANIFTSKNMHDWDHRGFVYECPYPDYNVAGEHWECVVMLPVSTADGSMTKYVLFDCPQYARGESAPQVECYYWIGTFDKVNCRFTPDDHRPRLFDIGTATFTGQNGYTFLTDEEREQGKKYEQGRTVIYAIAQGKDAGTNLNYNSGWAHNFAFPLELSLSADGNEIIRKPIREIESLYGETLYEYSGAGKSAAEINAEIENIRGDTVKIDMEFTIAPTSDSYSAKLGVRYNPYTSLEGTERTFIEFSNGKANIDRLQSTLRPGVVTQSLHNYEYGATTAFRVTVLLDRSMLEVYINDTVSGTARIYPHYGDSDYFRLFDENAGMTVTEFKITQMKSAYSSDGSITPPYYGNVGNLQDAE